MRAHNLNGILDISQSTARFYSNAEEVNSLAVIAIIPGSGLSSRWRWLAEKHKATRCVVLADLGRPISPDTFHQTTLRWAIYSADLIQIWSALSQRVHDFSDALAAADAGARFQTTIETTEQDAPDWLRFIERWQRKAASVKVYGPVDQFSLAISKI
jgi:hypothetical protein